MEQFFYDWEKMGKKRSKNQMIGDSGINILKFLFPQEWVVREYTADFGIDLDVELFETCGEGVPVTKGEHVLFQVKTTNNLEMKEFKTFPNTKSKDEFYVYKVFKYSIETSLLLTVEKMGSAVPVLLCLVDNIEREGYFVCLNDYIDKILIPHNPDYHMQERVTINVPADNKISSGKFAIEWYGKRAKMYSFFNIINSQNRDLLNTYNNFEEKVETFLKKICRLDIWSQNMLSMYKEMIDYYLKYHSTKEADRIIEEAVKRGEDVDEPIWEATFCMGEVSFRQATKTQWIHRLWDKLCLIADMYEDDYRNAYIPTYYWAMINE